MDLERDLEFLQKNRFTETSMEKNLCKEAFVREWETLISRHAGESWKLLREKFADLATWLPVATDGVKVYLHPTPAGQLPILECEDDGDFIYLMQNVAYRGQLRPVPDSQGAVFNKRHNIVLLSHRNYSGIPAELFGLELSDWRRKSLVLRREHEAAHYMTQRFYHSAKNEIHDEIIADFMGLTAAFGDYDPRKFAAFIGLDAYPKYRNGSRLEIYLDKGSNDKGGIKNKNFNLLCETILKVAENISLCYRKEGSDRDKMFHILCRTSVSDMAEGSFVLE